LGDTYELRILETEEMAAWEWYFTNGKLGIRAAKIGISMAKIGI
jgi:hypothetical protein